MKDIIQPTVKKKFDELILKYDEDRDTFFFQDDEGNNQMVYNRATGYIVIKMNYFMLQYFGVNHDTYDEDLNNIFIGLLRNYLGKEFQAWKLSHKNINYV